MDTRETAKTWGKSPAGTVAEIGDPEPESEPAQQALVKQALELERERIAAYLHDEVLQTFAVCSLKAQLCERMARTEQRELLGKELVHLEDLLVDSIDKVRELIGTLAQ